MPINKHLTLGTDHQGATALHVSVRAHQLTPNVTNLEVRVCHSLYADAQSLLLVLGMTALMSGAHPHTNSHMAQHTYVECSDRIKCSLNTFHHHRHHQDSCHLCSDVLALASRDLVLQAIYHFVLSGPHRIEMPHSKHLLLDMILKGATTLNVDIQPRLLVLVLVLQAHLRVVHQTGSASA